MAVTITDLLREAFPRHGEKGAPFCFWCGHDRESWMALCRSCWRGLDAMVKDTYIAMDMQDRARWIIQHKPQR